MLREGIEEFKNPNFPSPMNTPVKADAAYAVPSGIIKTKLTTLTITTSAARASTDMRPEKIASSSKTHHSKQIIHAPGIPILRYVPISLNISKSGFE